MQVQNVNKKKVLEVEILGKEVYKDFLFLDFFGRKEKERRQLMYRIAGEWHDSIFVSERIERITQKEKRLLRKRLKELKKYYSVKVSYSVSESSFNYKAIACERKSESMNYEKFRKVKLELLKLSEIELYKLVSEVMQKDFNLSLEILSVLDNEVSLNKIKEIVKDKEKYHELLKILTQYKMKHEETKTQNEKVKLFLELTKSLRQKAKERHKDHKNIKDFELLKTHYSQISDKIIYRYVLAIKTTKKQKAYYIIYTTLNLSKLTYHELSEVKELIVKAYFERQKRKLSKREFSIMYKNHIIVLQRFRKREIIALTHVHLLSVDDLVHEKLKELKKSMKIQIDDYIKAKYLNNLFVIDYVLKVM